MSYTIRNTFQMGPSKTGKSLRGQIVNDAGSNVGSEITTAVELTGGLGVFEQICTIPDGQEGFLRIYFSDAPTVFIASIPLNPREIENADAKSSAIKAKTDNLPPDPADASDVEDVITTATSGLSTLTTTDIDNRLAAYDAATGTEAAAILAAIGGISGGGGGGITIEDVETALGNYGAATGDDVASVAATIAANNPAGYNAGEITIQHATTIDRQIVNVTVMPATVTRAVLTVKRNVGDDDDKALLQIDSDGGLTRLNGAAVAGGVGATLSYSYAAKTVDFHIDDHICAELPVSTNGHHYDVKFHYPTSRSVSTAKMRFKILSVVTEAT